MASPSPARQPTPAAAQPGQKTVQPLSNWPGIQHCQNERGLDGLGNERDDKAMKTIDKNPMEITMDLWLKNLSTLCWAQDQGEKIVRSYMDQGTLAREEGLKVAERFAEQVKANQAEMQNMVDRSVKMAMETFQKTQKAQMDAFKTRIDEMNKTIENINKN